MAAGGLKQRLVGALVLFCAGVVLWSLLFTGPQVRPMDRTSQIPPPPEKTLVTVPEPQTVDVEPVGTDLNSEPKFDLSSDEMAGEEPVGALPVKSILPVAPTEFQDARGLPISWVVVVGSFSDANKAAAIQKDLQARAYKAFTETLKRDGRTLYRVSIGPKLQKAQADKIKREVDDLLKLTSVVKPYQLER